MTRIRGLFQLAACLAAMLMPPMAGATDASPDAPPMREVQLAPDAFVRAAPLPPWVQRQAVPATRRQEPVILRLRDTQVRLGDSVSTFVDRAVQVNDGSMLGQIGQQTIDFRPHFQRLNLHSVRLLRGDTVLERTASVDVRFLERETGMERGVYSGAVTVALVIPDVRAGDTLSIAYLIEGSNPVFGATFFDDYAWDGPAPTEWRRVTVTHPERRNLRWRMLGDYRPGTIEPRIEQAGGMRTLYFEERGLEPLADEPLVPDDYFRWRMLQLSEYADWNQVARWADALFPPIAALPQELEALLAEWAALPTVAARAAAATRWVQGEIRYFSLSFGESSHRPQAPDLVLQRRYGDCKDKTYLLLLLLRRLGVDAAPMLVSLQAPRAAAKTLPAPWVFDHVVIRAQVDGRVLYLEATAPPQHAALFAIGQPPPWFQGLVAAPQTTGPISLSDPGIFEPLLLEVEERITFDQLGAKGRLEARKTMNRSLAELVRQVWPRMAPEQRRQLALADYERRWPGIALVGEPQPFDDLELNRFGYSATYTVPQLAQPHDGGWLMRYAATALQGMVNLPPGLQRKFPLRVTDFPMERRYVLSVQWPSQVSAIEDPSSQTVDGLLFRAESRAAFRGSRYDFQLRLSTKAPDIAAADLPRLMQDLQRLDSLIPGRVVVARQMIGSAAATGPASAAAAMRREMQDRIDWATGAIRSGMSQGHDLARAHCRRAKALASLERVADGLADGAEAVRIAPDWADAWACRGEVLYFAGDFAEADAAMTKALALAPNGRASLQVRGMIRLYLGRPADAAADFALAGLPDEDGASEIYARLWQVFALQRGGLPLPADLLALARQDPQGAWPRPALAMLVGDLTPEALLAQAGTLQGDERTLTLAEAWFYVGQRHLVQGRTDAAREAFTQCRAQGITSYYEHVGAGFELARLGRP